HRVFGVRHDPHHVAGGVADRGDVTQRTVRVRAGVPGHHPAGRLQLVQGRLVGHVPSLAALQRHHDLLADVVAVGPGGAVGLDPQPQVPVAEVEVCVAGERPGQQVRLTQDLEPVADTEYGQPGTGGGRERLHHRGEPGDGTAPQVVAVGE